MARPSAKCVYFCFLLLLLVKNTNAQRQKRATIRRSLISYFSKTCRSQYTSVMRRALPYPSATQERALKSAIRKLKTRTIAKVKGTSPFLGFSRPCLNSRRAKRDATIDGCCKQEHSFNTKRTTGVNVHGKKITLHNEPGQLSQTFHEVLCVSVPWCGIGTCTCVLEQRYVFAIVKDPVAKAIKSDYIQIPACCRSIIS